MHFIFYLATNFYMFKQYTMETLRYFAVQNVLLEIMVVEN